MICIPVKDISLHESEHPHMHPLPGVAGKSPCDHLKLHYVKESIQAKEERSMYMVEQYWSNLGTVKQFNSNTWLKCKEIFTELGCFQVKLLVLERKLNICTGSSRCLSQINFTNYLTKSEPNCQCMNNLSKVSFLMCEDIRSGRGWCDLSIMSTLILQHRVATTMQLV